MSKLPYMQWYPTDWIADTRILSLSARGAWADTLAVLWNAPERGVLKLPERAWARIWGTEPERVDRLLLELGNCAGIRREPSGTMIWSRRMIREEIERERSRNSKKSKDEREYPYKKRISGLIPDLFPENSRTIPGDIPEARDQTLELTPLPPKGAESGKPDDSECLLVEFWKQCPETSRRRSSKALLRKEWGRVPKHERPSLETILGALAAFKRTPEWKRDNYQFVPGVHRLIKMRFWEDPPEPDRPFLPRQKPPSPPREGELETDQAAALWRELTDTGHDQARAPGGDAVQKDD